MSTIVDPADEQMLVDRMSAIRNLSEQHVAELHHEAGRLVDWREHVRSKPLVAVAAAAVVGFSLLNHRRRSRSQAPADPVGSRQSQKAKEQDEHTQEVTTKASIASGLMAFAGSLASSMVKQYASNYVRNQLGGVHDDRSHTASRKGRGSVSR